MTPPDALWRDGSGCAIVGRPTLNRRGGQHMALMKAMQVSKPGGQFELVERPIPEPGRGQVRIKVEACGVCHSDVVVKDGLWPGLQYPRVPGHEIAGRVDAVGTDVANWKAGQRVGVAGTAGIALRAVPAGEAVVFSARSRKSPPSAPMAATPNT